MEIYYPRVLIIHISKVKADDGSNLLIRTQFGAWPKEKLAQVHAEVDSKGYGDFCGQYYRLQKNDRFMGSVFYRMRQQVYSMVELVENVETKISNYEYFARYIKKRLGNYIINTGLWEVIFKVRLSDDLIKFIIDFNPDIIYCQGYSLGFTTLPLKISNRFNVPICFQTTDDWPNQMYRFSPVGWLLRRRSRELINAAKVRLAFGEKMTHEYDIRYGVPFNISYHLDEKDRFLIKENESRNKIKIIYTGGLGHCRYEAIADLLNAVQHMPTLRDKVEIIIYTAGIPKDMPKRLLTSSIIKIEPLPSHNNLPAVLSEADILLLPESFNEDRKAIEYSISTKAHLYMMSQKPILVYGPPYSGTVNYAMNNGWGFVVNERSKKKLIEELMNIYNEEKRNQKLHHARECIINNHDLVEGRKKIYELLMSIRKKEACN
jgi:glycosyltransferase involved in cell wall biosynthesis